MRQREVHSMAAHQGWTCSGKSPSTGGGAAGAADGDGDCDGPAVAAAGGPNHCP